MSIILNLFKNGNLAQLIEVHIESGLNIDEWKILNWAFQATQGLKALHDEEIIHRDIKPENIYLSYEDKIKLGDLGSAKTIEENQKKSGNFTTAGSPWYMSPEIIEGQSYSFNTDIWSLGCVVYELTYKNVAFKGAGLRREVKNLEFKDSKLTPIIKK